MQRRYRFGVWAAALACAACSTTTTVPETVSATSSATRGIESSTPDVPASSSPEVETLFGEGGWSRGERLAIAVAKLPGATDSCVLHTYTAKGRTRAAYRSDCRSWENSGYDILLLYVGVRNISARPATISVRDWVLVARDGRSFPPVNVRSAADSPSNFLPEATELARKTSVLGFLAFDGRDPDLVPARLSYVDGDQTLTVVFGGRPRTNR
jgi:hypothetical protein